MERAALVFHALLHMIINACAAPGREVKLGSRILLA